MNCGDEDDSETKGEEEKKGVEEGVEGSDEKGDEKGEEESDEKGEDDEKGDEKGEEDDIIQQLIAAGAVICPWCGAACMKNQACQWVCCGLTPSGFYHKFGCGRQFCFSCGCKLCGEALYGSDGKKQTGVSTNHSDLCCPITDDYCEGGHNSHKLRRKIE